MPFNHFSKIKCLLVEIFPLINRTSILDLLMDISTNGESLFLSDKNNKVAFTNYSNWLMLFSISIVTP